MSQAASISWRAAAAALLLSSLAMQSTHAQDVRVVADIAYKSGDVTAYEAERSKLDLYLPADREGFPVMVWFHGGSLTTGDKAGGGQDAIATGLAARGIAVASANYRLSPQATYPAYIEDASASVAWVLDNITEYGGDPDAVFVAGHSAGGYLAFMVGLDPEYLASTGHTLDELAGLIPISGQTITHETVRGERGLPTNRPLIDAAAPSFHVAAGAPPVLAIAGSEDLPARAEENAYLVAALQAVGHEEASYREFEGRTHGSIVTRIPESDDPVAAAIVEFVSRLAR